jgi:hypothetical protein
MMDILEGLSLYVSVQCHTGCAVVGGIYNTAVPVQKSHVPSAYFTDATIGAIIIPWKVCKW